MAVIWYFPAMKMNLRRWLSCKGMVFVCVIWSFEDVYKRQHMMGGLDTPTSGTVIVRGEELAKKNDEQLTIFRRRNIGFIFQNYNLVPILNVYENIVLPVELDGDTVDQIPPCVCQPTTSPRQESGS